VPGAQIQGLSTPSRRASAGSWIGSAYAAAIYLFLYAPLLCLIVLSFNDSEGTTLPWRGFTLRWYGVAFADNDLRAAFWNSIVLAAATVAISVPLGVLGVYALRRRFRLHGQVLGLILVALIAPAIVVGVAQNIVWTLVGMPASLLGSTLIGHVTYTIPFVFVIAYPSFHRFDAALEEAALDLGAKRWRVFMTIVLPIAKPGVIASAVFAFMLSFDEFIRTFFLIGTDNTLPIYLWSMMLGNISPETNAVGTLMILFSIVLLLIGNSLLRQTYRS
jgi:spermidine/putrescine transport system permease protein